MKTKTAVTLLVFVLISTACRSATPATTPEMPLLPTINLSPTATFIDFPTATPLPIPTKTPTPTITPTVEPHEHAITAQNADQIILLDQFGNKHPENVSWSPDGTTIAVASDTDITIYNSETLEIIDVIDPDFAIKHIAYGPDANKLFIANQYFGVWDLNKNHFIGSYGYIEGGIRSFSMSKDGQILAISGPAWGGGGDPDYIFGFYNMFTGKKIFSRQQYGYTTSVAVSADGSLVAASVEFSGLEIYNGHSGELVKTIKPRPDGDLFFGPDPTVIILCSEYYDYITLLDIDTEESQEIDVDSCKNLIFSDDGQKMAFIAQGNTVNVFDTENYQLIQTQINLQEHIYSLDFSPDAESLAVVTQDSIIIWDIETDQITNSLSEFTPALNSVAFSPDSRIVLGGYGSYTPEGSWQTIYQDWDIESGAEIGEEIITIQDKPESDITTLSPDGKIRISIREDYSNFPSMEIIQLIDTDTEQVLHELSGHEARPGDRVVSWSFVDFVFNRDSSILISAGFDNAIRIWDVHTGELLNEFRHLLLSDIVISPDGRYIATSSWDGTIRLWGIPSP